MANIAPVLDRATMPLAYQDPTSAVPAGCKTSVEPEASFPNNVDFRKKDVESYAVETNLSTVVSTSHTLPSETSNDLSDTNCDELKPNNVATYSDRVSPTPSLSVVDQSLMDRLRELKSYTSSGIKKRLVYPTAEFLHSLEEPFSETMVLENKLRNITTSTVIPLTNSTRTSKSYPWHTQYPEDAKSCVNHSDSNDDIDYDSNIPVSNGKDHDFSDGETFEGRIVYNPDGSAYIIEGESESGDQEPFLKVPEQDGAIVETGDHVNTSTTILSYPPIASAIYIQRPVSNLCKTASACSTTSPSSTCPATTPVIYSYRVFDMRSNGKVKDVCSLKDVGNQIPMMSKCFSEVTSIPTKPILMCFICKLSFGYAKSLVAHSTIEHGMTLNADECTMVSGKNASALIQCIGPDKSPLMSFLVPVQTLPSKISCDTSLCSIPSNFVPSPHLSSSSQRMVNRLESLPSDTSVSYVYSNPSDIFTNKTFWQDRESNFRNSRSHSLVPFGIYKTGTSIKKDEAILNQNGKYTKTSSTFEEQLRSSQFKENGIDSCSEKQLKHEVPESGSSGVWRKAVLCADDALEKNNNFVGDEGVGSSVNKIPHTSRSKANEFTQFDMFKMSSFSRSCPVTSNNFNSLNYLPNSFTQTMMSSTTNDINEGDEHTNSHDVNSPQSDSPVGRQHSPLSVQTLNNAALGQHSRNSCKTLKCPKCNWHYKYQETLEIHMKDKHPESETQCPYCMNAQSHPRLARGETYTCGYKPYRCDICNYSTTTKGNLSIHLQSDKHTNNMQELQNSAMSNVVVDIKMPMTPPVVGTPIISSNGAVCNNSAGLIRNGKNRATWRCHFCSYETTEARNLRIHMTSEKHVHNFHTLQHSKNDIQMNPLAMFASQDPRGAMLGMSPLMGILPSTFDPSVFLSPYLTNMNSFESAMDLTKPSNSSDIVGMKDNELVVNALHNPRMSIDVLMGMFRCIICGIFSSDTLEGLQNHIQEDRLKEGATISDLDTIKILAGGTYLCSLCQYKTSLKANFQLHCKTDKHLQRLQLVNHIQEGTTDVSEVSQRLMSASSSPVQVSCGACDYHTNSVYRLQMHTTGSSHEVNAGLYRHLTVIESRFGAMSRGGVTERKRYGCTMCGYWGETKQSLIEHAQCVRHIQMQGLLVSQLKEHGKMDTMFIVEECPENSDGQNNESGMNILSVFFANDFLKIKIEILQVDFLHQWTPINLFFQKNVLLTHQPAVKPKNSVSLPLEINFPHPFFKIIRRFIRFFILFIKITRTSSWVFSENN